MKIPKPGFAFRMYVDLETLTPFYVFLFLIYTISLPFLVCFERLKKWLIMFLVAMFGPPLGIVSYSPTGPHQSSNLYIGLRKATSRNLFVMLHYLSFLIVLNLCTVFWDIFLLEESYICDDIAIDCFISRLGAKTMENISTFQLVTNCSLYHNLDVEFICYRFSFSVGLGLAAVGGLFSVLNGIVKVISVVALKMYSCVCVKRRNRLYLVVIFLDFSGCIGFMLVIGYYYLSDSSKHGFLAPYQSLIKIFAIVVTFMFGVAVPWHTVLPDEDNDNQSDTSIE